MYTTCNTNDAEAITLHYGEVEKFTQNFSQSNSQSHFTAVKPLEYQDKYRTPKTLFWGVPGTTFT